MTDDTRNSVGVDISKAHLDAYMVPAGKAARFSNDAAGLKALIAWSEWWPCSCSPPRSGAPPPPSTTRSPAISPLG